jgi:hypothetical protein
MTLNVNNINFMLVHKIAVEFKMHKVNVSVLAIATP